jgi:hypothetical protein
MTAPDHFAKTDLNPFAGGGRPHMIYNPFSRSNRRRAGRIDKIPGSFPGSREYAAAG